MAPLPANDAATFRDILLFEERLKTTAQILKQRKHRYQLFLLQLCLLIVFLLSEVLAYTQILGLLCEWVVRIFTGEEKWGLRVESGFNEGGGFQIASYISTGLLFVSVTTLVLFFASGMYSEKIAYANQYVPHANRALRSFNMYLNVRKPPLTSKLPFKPLSFFFPRSPPSPPSSPPGTTVLAPSQTHTRRTRSRSPSPRSDRSAPMPQPIPPIPPSTNPRGELIFSSRVDKGFREGYERHRANFEKRRAERARVERARKSWVNWVRMKIGWPLGLPAAASSATATANASGAGEKEKMGTGASASTTGMRSKSPSVVPPS